MRATDDLTQLDIMLQKSEAILPESHTSSKTLDVKLAHLKLSNDLTTPAPGVVMEQYRAALEGLRVGTEGDSIGEWKGQWCPVLHGISADLEVERPVALAAEPSAPVLPPKFRVQATVRDIAAHLRSSQYALLLRIAQGQGLAAAATPRPRRSPPASPAFPGSKAPRKPAEAAAPGAGLVLHCSLPSASLALSSAGSTTPFIVLAFDHLRVDVTEQSEEVRIARNGSGLSPANPTHCVCAPSS